MVQWVLRRKNNIQWVLLSYTIEEKTTGVWCTVSTVKLYNRRKNNMGESDVQWVLLSYTIEEKTTWVWWYSEYC